MVCSAICSLQKRILWVFLTYFAKSASLKYILKLKKLNIQLGVSQKSRGEFLLVVNLKKNKIYIPYSA